MKHSGSAVKTSQGRLSPSVRLWLVHQGVLGGQRPPVIDPDVGAPQSDIFFHYKMALLHATALDRATRDEERRARREKRSIRPEGIERLTERYLARIPYKRSSCTYHSFVVYFSNLQRLGWVEPSGVEEPSAFQDHYLPGPPRRYYRLTPAGRAAPDTLWSDPLSTLYGYR